MIIGPSYDHRTLALLTSGSNVTLKMLFFSSLTANLAELKTHIPQHFQNVTSKTLQSVVEHADYWLQFLAQNGG